MRTQVSTRVERGPTETEDLMRGGMVIVCACFALSLLAAGTSLPLSWLPGQLPILCLTLVLLPGSVVIAAGRHSALAGLAASDFALRVGVTRWVTVGLFVVALPIYQDHSAAHSASGQNPLISIGIATTLCVLIGTMAGTLAGAWATLQVQEWEVTDSDQVRTSAVSLETAGRVNRGIILRDLWRGWMGGEITLAGAFLLSTQLSHGHQVAATLGLLAFLVYTVVGLLLLSQAARARQMVQWRLSGVEVPEELVPTWNGTGLRVVVGVTAGFGLFLLVHGLDVAHATVKWTADTLIVPAMSPLLDWLRRMGNGNAGSCTGTSGCGESSPVRNLPVPPRAAPTHHAPATEIDFSLLQHIWPEIVGIVVLCLVILTYWRTRGNTTGRGIWREMLAVLYRDLRLLLGLLRRPARRLLAEIAERSRAMIVERSTRGRRRDSAGWTTPRRTIIGLYLRALTFATRRGLARQPGRTPREYADDMAVLCPAGSDTFERMTELFVSARYAQEPITEDGAGRMRTLWTAFRAKWARGGK